MTVYGEEAVLPRQDTANVRGDLPVRAPVCVQIAQAGADRRTGTESGGSDGTSPAKSGISIIGQIGILGARVRKNACLPREASHAAMI